MDDTQLAEVIAITAGCRDAHARLLATVEALPGEAARRPSRLPDWTVGHVLTHIARNADSHVRMLTGARRGEVRDQYAGGAEGRQADIEAGAVRPLPELVDDVRTSSAQLETLWDEMEPGDWEAGCRTLGGARSCRELPFMRWREVEVHHLDLGAGYGPADWPDGYVTRELPGLLATLPERLTEPMSRRAVVAWLLDRGGLPAEIPIRGWQK